MLTIDELISLDRQDGLAVSAEEGRILMDLVKKYKPKIILEVGTGHGYSTSWIYHGMDEDAIIWTLDKEVRKHLFTQDKRIKFLEGKLDELMDKIPQEIDLIFLDTEHMIYKVVPDIELLVPRIKPGKVIIIHDTEYRTVMGGCLVDYFKGKLTDRLEDNGCQPSKNRWRYQRIVTEYGLGIATLKKGKRG